MSRRRNREARASTAIPRRSPWPVVVYTLAALIAVAGLAETTFLTVKHLTGETLVCLASSGCSAVLNSKYASWGSVPTAGFGALAYFSAFSTAVLCAFGYSRPYPFFCGIVALMFLFTCWFLYLQVFVLKAFCDYCLLSAAFCFALAGLAVAAPRPSPTAA